MKLSSCPWQTAWHDGQTSERLVQELAKLEKGTVQNLESSAQWMEHLLVELGQLAQHMIQLEQNDPHPPQLLLASDRSVKLAALAVHLAGALQQAHRLAPTAGSADEAAEPPAERRPRKGMAAAVEAATQQAEARGMPAAEPDPGSDPAPMRRTIHTLADRGISIAEIEVITGHPPHVIQAILNDR